MRPDEALSGIDVAVLAGGLGTRLRGLAAEPPAGAGADDTPRVLAPVAGRAFLGHLLDHLGHHGARRVVLCLGHLADRVTAWLAQGGGERGGAHGLDVVCSVEPRPLGTAGALRYVREELASDPVLVARGDTFLDADLRAFVASHALSGAAASVLCARVADAAGRRLVEVGADGRVRGFSAGRPGPGIIDAGVYLFSAAFLDAIVSGGAVSLERDVLPAAAPGTLHGHVATARFIDIGGPEVPASAERS